MTLQRHEIDAITALYQRHQSLRRVGNMLGYSPNTVRKYVQAHYEIHTQNIVTSVKTNDDRLIGTYIGLWMGDGTQYISEGSYVVKFCLHADHNRMVEFIQELLVDLFGKSSHVVKSSIRKRQYVRLYSKFLFKWVEEYTAFSDNKTQTVRLKDSVSTYSTEFIEGCLLGLMLSDGYLKKKALFNVVSQELASDMYSILESFGYAPQLYVHDRSSHGWNDLHMVSLRVDDSQQLCKQLDVILTKLGCEWSFEELKYE